ncbi:MAG: GTP-dependent dephospho-CoA kinase family protein [Candidatus Bathyarchaeia archaeon]
MRRELKKPIGKILIGTPEDNAVKMRSVLERVKPPIWASVGDFVSGTLLENHLEPDIIVIDHRIMRIHVEPLELEREAIHAKNRAGTINRDACKALGRAISLKKKVAVIVKGEEDLLVLPLMAMMPNDSLIIYGQPRKGMVIVPVNEEKRRWALDFMERMEEKNTENRRDNH